MQVAGYCVGEASLVLPGAAFISQPPEGRRRNWGRGGAHKAAGSERSPGKQERRPSIGENSVDFSLFLSSNSEAVEIKDLISCVGACGMLAVLIPSNGMQDIQSCQVCVLENMWARARAHTHTNIAAGINSFHW